MAEPKSAVVLGCGMVGATIARDLAREPGIDVLAVDVNAANLGPLEGLPRISVRTADLSTTGAVESAVADADVVIGALPGALGLETLRTVIRAGRPCCDISFMPEDATALDGLAREHGVTVVIDCGVAPGLANMIIGHCTSMLDETRDVVIYVGGLPRNPRWPYGYKAPFSPADVVEEYTRPARFIENGEVVTKPALSDVEQIEFPDVGTLEAFNTDGLRSLLGLKVQNMREKTLRWPGHAELMRVLRETGFFGQEAIEVAGVRVRPLDVTSRLLFPMWKLEEGEVDFTLMRVSVAGVRDGRTQAHEYDLYDEYDAATGEHSMARTTGYPCTAVARMLLEGRFARPGVHAPETLGREPGLLDDVIGELASRGVHVRATSPGETT